MMGGSKPKALLALGLLNRIATGFPQAQNLIVAQNPCPSGHCRMRPISLSLLAPHSKHTSAPIDSAAGFFLFISHRPLPELTTGCHGFRQRTASEQWMEERTALW